MCLSTLLSLLPAAPVTMTAPSSSTLKEIQEQLDKFRRLAAEELGKQLVNDTRVAQYQKQADILLALIHQASGELQNA